MPLRSFIKDYLVVTRKERIGVITILFLLVCLMIVPRFFKAPSKAFPIDSDNEWSKMMHSIDTNSWVKADEENISQFVYDKNENDYTSPINSTLFYFDPNTLDAPGWKKLGIRDKTIQTILNYRNKGGRFRKAADLERIYGLSRKDFDRLEPYIRINDNREQKTYTNYTQPAYTTPAKKEYAIKIVDINKADAEAWIALPGIGEKLSARIMNFRNKLGGFYSIDQVGETYGLPDSTFQKIKQHLQVHEPALKTININTASKEALKAHPYITWNVANAIIEYRNQHGNFKSVADLKKLVLIDDALFEKIQHYLSVE